MKGWTDCSLYDDCKDGRKDIMTYCEICCHNPDKQKCQAKAEEAKAVPEDVREQLAEIVLEIRTYLLSTEFAPEPFTEPVNIDKLKISFPNQIIAQVIQPLLEKARQERRSELIETLRDYLTSLSPDDMYSKCRHFISYQ